MKVSCCSLCLYLLISCCVNIVKTDGNETRGENCTDILFRVLGAVEKAVAFFSREYRNINLDALLGLRMTQGQLSTILQTLSGKTSPLHTYIDDEVRGVLAEAGDICEQAMPHVKRNYPQDYNHLRRLVTTEGLWSADSQPRLIDKRLLSKQEISHVTKETLNEETTDECFAELLGESKSFPRSPCSISNRCWKLMSAPGYGGYSLTHQILYYQIGLKMDCTRTLKKRFDGPNSPYDEVFSPGSMLSDLCASEYQEAESIAANGYPEGRQDLFMEQGLLCGHLGYQDFYRRDWLDKILSWQDASGCFKNNSYVRVTSEATEKLEHFRTKRRENIVSEDGCLVHKTSVALGYLSGYLRLLLQSDGDQSGTCFLR